MVRPKKHSIHPAGTCHCFNLSSISKVIIVADIHILVNTVYSPSIVNSPASASWIPVCLPKFNPAGFVNAYITFLRRPDADQISSQKTTGDGEDGAAEKSQTSWKTTRLMEDSGIGLVCISGGGELETVRAWCDTVTQVRSNICFRELRITYL